MIVYMHRSLWVLCALVSSFSSAWAQLPPNQPEQDCFSAIPVCQDVYVQTNSYSGAGNNPDEINGAFSCMLLGERNSVWYTFRIQTAGQLCFTITPNVLTEDYDWALFNITNSSCAAIPNDPSLEVSCSFQAPDQTNGCTGETGANGDTAPPCGIQNQACLTVQVGETYVLNVSNFTGFDNGYTLDFSASTAVLFDDMPPDMTGAGHFCEGARVSFSENILCNTVDPTDFTFTGPGGPYTVTDVRSAGCDNGADYDNTFDLVVEPAITTAADYTVSLVGVVSDFCGNAANLNSQTVFLTPIPQASIDASPPQCLEVNRFNFTYSGTEGGGLIGFNWDFGDSTGAVVRNPTRIYESSGFKDVRVVVQDARGCTDTATATVEVYPTPVAVIDSDPTLCQLDSVQIGNLSRIDSTAQITRYSWSFGDGGFSNDTTPLHSYQNPGPHLILLTVESATGCMDTAQQNVLVYPAPEVDFLTEEDVCLGDPATLQNLSTIRNDIANDFIDSWTWQFGDGATAGSLPTPTHLYAAADTFDVTLTAVSDKGCRDSLLLPQVVYQTPDPDLQHDSVCFGQRAFLSVEPIEGGIVEWFRSENDTVPFHLGRNYLTDPVLLGDTYFVEVVSPQQCRSNRSAIFAPLHDEGTGAIFASDTVMEMPNAIVSLGLNGSIQGDDYRWDFGDGTLSTASEPAHEYQYPGKYLVELAVVDVNGCEYELEQLIEVKKIVQVHVPTAFTPNGDGFNDEFFVRVYKIQQFRIQIFNRHGRLVFESSDPDFRWNGQTTEGGNALEGVYVYQVQAMDFDGILMKETGTITLFR